MKRSAFIASVFGFIGIGKAQQWKECTTGKPGTTAYITEPRCYPPKNHPEPALNNQCPVCGTMAAPYSPGMIFNAVGTCLDREGKETACSKAPRIIRCKRCNAAFWQDAEGGQEK